MAKILYRNLCNTYHLHKQAIINLINHDGVEHAGYMSFIILLSLFPFLIFFLNFSYLLGAHHVGQQLITVLLSNAPANLIKAIESQLNGLYTYSPPRAMNFAILGVIWTSSSFIESIRTILNRIYEVNYPSYIWRRFLSIIQFFLITASIFCLMFIWLTFTISASISSEISNLIAKLPYKGGYISIGTALLLFVSTLYCMVPNTKIQINRVLPGAFTTVILWLISAYMMSKYISYYTQLDFIYGSLGSIVIILMFFYVVSVVFIYGAELNFLLAKKHIGQSQQ